MAGEPKAYAKPLPHLDEENRPWWEALKRHELYLQRCRDCGALRYYPRALCPECLSSRTEWIRSKGSGKVYTFTITYQNAAAGFRDALPYVLAYVELDEGLKMLTNIVDCRPEQVRIGMPVAVVFDDVTPEVTLAKFRPAV
ncbi:MAG TPA: Zn-ribbon domain-containing OB-fold protein [Candidatus Binataceae bacterium]|nr:Zn-ribbon domain-containing OB-fold protein [Candidatus Binataceae bacterium]